MGLFWEEVFRSFDSIRADSAAQALRAAGIDCRRRSINLLESAMSANRGRMGSFGINEQYRYIYAVKVHKRDVSQAKYILRNLHN
ncbi:MAG: DUF2007 domain-containing protein [Clostridia bacterium]|nr:DUF2007 domain-containing protein [Clostridia bacterium]